MTVERSLSTLAEALEIDPDAFDQAAAAAWKLLGDGRVDEAIELFRGLSALSPVDLDLARGLALGLVKKSDLAAAIEVLDVAIDTGRAASVPDREIAELETLRAAQLAREDRREEALASAERALFDAAPDAPYRAILEAGRDHLFTTLTGGKGPDASAKDVVRELEARLHHVVNNEAPLAFALGLDEDALSKAFDRGQVLFQSGQGRRAELVFAGLAALDPRVPAFSLALGVVRESLGDRSGARGAFGDAIQVAAQAGAMFAIEAEARLRRAWLSIEGNLIAEAAKDLDAVLARPGDLDATVARRAASLRAALNATPKSSVTR